MDNRTAAAAISMIGVTFVLGMMAVAQLGGFGSAAGEHAAPTIVTALSLIADTAASSPSATTTVVIPPGGVPTAGHDPGSSGGESRPSTTTARTPEATSPPAPAPSSPSPIGAPTSSGPDNTPGGGAQRTSVSGQPIPASWQLSTSWLASGKPIPSYPAGCEQGQLEDNGRWNCE